MKTLTDKIVMVVASALVLLDIVLAVTNRPTISATIKTWAGTDDLWVLPLAWACLFGHFFLLRAQPLPMMGLRTCLVAVVFIGCIALNLTIVRTVPVWMTGAAGIALGAGLWAQSAG